MIRSLALLAVSLSLSTLARGQVAPSSVPAGPGRFAVTFDTPFISDSYPIGVCGHYNQLLGLYVGPFEPGCGPVLGGCSGAWVGPGFGVPPVGLTMSKGMPIDLQPLGASPQATTEPPPPAPSMPAGNLSPPPPDAPEPDPTLSPGTAEAPGASPALVLSLVDLDDPAPVGSDVMFVVLVVNQGPVEARDLRVTVDLPDGLRFGGLSGSSIGEADGPTVTFKPVETLAPGADLRWRVLARAEQAGEFRTRVELRSPSIDAPASDVEATVVVPQTDSPPVDAEPLSTPAPPAPGLDLPGEDATNPPVPEPDQTR
jgi:hypothetical protein